MARKCKHSDDDCACNIRYPDGTFVMGSGTSNEPLNFADCDLVFETQDDDSERLTIACGGQLPICPAAPASDLPVTIITPPASTVTTPTDPFLDPQPTLADPPTQIQFDYISFKDGLIDDDITDDLTVVAEQDIPTSPPRDTTNVIFDNVNFISLVSPFDLDVKFFRRICFYVSVTVCQRTPAPSIVLGECREFGLNISNINNAVAGIGKVERFEPEGHYWYPPDSSDASGCANFVFKVCTPFPPGFYSQMRINLLHSHLGQNLPFNDSRQLYVYSGNIIMAW